GWGWKRGKRAFGARTRRRSQAGRGGDRAGRRVAECGCGDRNHALRVEMTIVIDPRFAPLFAFLFGACIGSFLNVCIARWPLEQSVVRPRSRCPKCGHQLAWFENIPLLSWVALRARCRCCTESISPTYPLVELLIALGWLS